MPAPPVVDLNALTPGLPSRVAVAIGVGFPESTDRWWAVSDALDGDYVKLTVPGLSDAGLVATSPDGNLLVLTVDGRLHLYDLTVGAEVWDVPLPPGWLAATAVSSSGDSVTVAMITEQGRDGLTVTVAQLDPMTGDQRTIWQDDTQNIAVGLALHPVDPLLAVTHDDVDDDDWLTMVLSPSGDIRATLRDFCLAPWSDLAWYRGGELLRGTKPSDNSRSWSWSAQSGLFVESNRRFQPSGQLVAISDSGEEVWIQSNPVGAAVTLWASPSDMSYLFFIYGDTYISHIGITAAASLD